MMMDSSVRRTFLEVHAADGAQREPRLLQLEPQICFQNVLDMLTDDGSGTLYWGSRALHPQESPQSVKMPHGVQNVVRLHFAPQAQPSRRTEMTASSSSPVRGGAGHDGVSSPRVAVDGGETDLLYGSQTGKYKYSSPEKPWPESVPAYFSNDGDGEEEEEEEGGREEPSLSSSRAHLLSPAVPRVDALDGLPASNPASGLSPRGSSRMRQPIRVLGRSSTAGMMMAGADDQLYVSRDRHISPVYRPSYEVSLPANNVRRPSASPPRVPSAVGVAPARGRPSSASSSPFFFADATPAPLPPPLYNGGSGRRSVSARYYYHDQSNNRRATPQTYYHPYYHGGRGVAAAAAAAAAVVAPAAPLRPAVRGAPPPASWEARPRPSLSSTSGSRRHAPILMNPEILPDRAADDASSDRVLAVLQRELHDIHADIRDLKQSSEGRYTHNSPRHHVDERAPSPSVVVTHRDEEEHAPALPFSAYFPYSDENDLATAMHLKQMEHLRQLRRYHTRGTYSYQID